MAITFNGDTVKSITYTDKQGNSHSLDKLFKDNQRVWVKPATLTYNKAYDASGETSDVHILTTLEPSKTERYLSAGGNDVNIGDEFSYAYLVGTETVVTPSGAGSIYGLLTPTMDVLMRAWRVTFGNSNSIACDLHIQVVDLQNLGTVIYEDTVEVAAGDSYVKTFNDLKASYPDGIKVYGTLSLTKTTTTYTYNSSINFTVERTETQPVSSTLDLVKDYGTIDSDNIYCTDVLNVSSSTNTISSPRNNQTLTINPYVN